MLEWADIPAAALVGFEDAAEPVAVEVTEACELEGPAFEPVPDPVDVDSDADADADADVDVAVAATEVEVGRVMVTPAARQLAE